MESRHQRSLFSTYVALQQLVEEVRDIATRGLSPAHAAGQMTPLPPPEREKLEAGLDALLAQARELLARHAPDLLAEHERPRSVAHTRSWIDVLLGRAQGLVDDLDPERMASKYGGVTPEENADLAPRIAAMREQLRRLRGGKG